MIMQEEENTEPIFQHYVPLPDYAMLPHPEVVTETMSLACVAIKQPEYQPKLNPNWLIPSSSRLSGVQMDAVVMAGASHSHLINGRRQGFILGDGTGIGKGREIIAIIMDNVFQDRLKSVWVSCSRTLFKDALRDLNDVLEDDQMQVKMHLLTDIAKFDWENITSGILFLTYKMLSKKNDAGKFHVADAISKWLGINSDAVIVFDEAHKAKGLKLTENKSTNMGLSVERLQEINTNCRFVYATATIGTTPADLSYVKTLGLWDENAGFGGRPCMDFFMKRGLAGSEVLSAQLKCRGVMISRQLSYSDIVFEVETASLTNKFAHLYDSSSDLWRYILEATTSIKTENRHIMAAYWSSTQYFFKALCISSKIQTLIEKIRSELDNGCSVVISLTTIHEELYRRFRESKFHDCDLEVFRPTRQILEEFITFKLGIDPIDLGLVPKSSQTFKQNNPKSDQPDQSSDSEEEDYEEINVTQRHKRRKTQVGDKPEIEENLKQSIVESYKNLVLLLPENPLDILHMEFTKSCGIVELTSRHYMQHLERRNDAIEVVSDVIRHTEGADQFQSGNCRIALISEASSTGISLHRSVEVTNMDQRVHIMLETPWTSLSALQSLGRTHRSNQISPPRYLLLTSKFPGEERFVNAVAGRICNLGAICKADRRSAFNEVWKTFQICPSVSKKATREVLENIIGSSNSLKIFHDYNQKHRIDMLKVLKEIDLIVSNTKEQLVPNAKLLDQEKFLNRMLVLKYNQQQALMAYYKVAVEIVIEQSPLLMNDGVESLSSAVDVKFFPIRTEKFLNQEGLECSLHSFQCEDFREWNTVNAMKDIQYFQSKTENGKIMAVLGGNFNGDPSYQIFYPHKHTADYFTSKRFLKGYKFLDKSSAKILWKKQVDLLYDGACIESVRRQCNQVNCSHQRCVYNFGFFTGVISKVLMDLISEIHDERELKLVYHKWDNKSDTGLYVPEKLIQTLRKCLANNSFNASA